MATTKIIETAMCSYFEGGIKNTIPTSELSVKEIHQLITKDEDFKGLTERVRSCNDSLEKKQIKSKLPYVTFQVNVSKRSSDSVNYRTGILSFDIDDIDNPELLKKQLSVEERILLIHTTSSGEGLRVLMLCDIEIDHQNLFYAVQSYLLTTYSVEVDKQCSDLVRASFLSYDSDTYFNEGSKTIDETFVKIWLPITSSTVGVNKTKEIKVVNLKMSDKRKTYYGELKLSDCKNRLMNMKDGEKHSVLLKVSRNLGAYIKYGLLQYEEVEDTLHNVIDDLGERVTDKKLAYNTIEKGIRYGIEKSYDISKEIVTDEEVFWYVNQKKESVSVHISYTGFYDYLEQNGFHLYIKNGGKQLISIEDNLVSVVDKHHFSRFVMDKINNLPFYIGEGATRSQLKEAYRNKLGLFSSDNQLYANPPVQLEFNKDDAETCHLYFSNGAVVIKKDSVELIEYSKLQNCIWKSQIIDKEFDVTNFDTEDLLNKSEYAQFIKVVCNNDDERIDSLMTTKGYLLHSYKNPSVTKAIILCDENISPNPTGGSGKGIFIKALSYLKNVTTIDGKRYNSSDRFGFSQVEMDTNILAFDDIPLTFNFENLFSSITEGLSVEKKGKDRMYVPYKESPNFIISSNYMVEGIGNSHERRKFEFEFGHGYNESRTPYSDFGHNLFDDWDKNQWDYFYAFMIKCVQKFLNHGLIEPKALNLETRKIAQATSDEFMIFANDILTNHEYNKHHLLQCFFEMFPEFRELNWFNQRLFNKWLRKYGEFRSYVLEERITNNNPLIKFTTP